MTRIWAETAALMAVALAIAMILFAVGWPFWAAVLVTAAIFLAADYYHYYQSKGGRDE